MSDVISINGHILPGQMIELIDNPIWEKRFDFWSAVNFPVPTCKPTVRLFSIEVIEQYEMPSILHLQTQPYGKNYGLSENATGNDGLLNANFAVPIGGAPFWSEETVCLDYSQGSNPRVLFSVFCRGCRWLEVAPDFAVFEALLPRYVISG